MQLVCNMLKNLKLGSLVWVILCQRQFREIRCLQLCYFHHITLSVLSVLCFQVWAQLCELVYYHTRNHLQCVNVSFTMCNVSNKKRLMGEMHDCVAQGWFDMLALCVTAKESLEIFVCKQCPALNDFVEQTGTVEWVRRIKLIIAHNSLTLFVVTGSFVTWKRKSHSLSRWRTRTSIMSFRTW